MTDETYSATSAELRQFIERTQMDLRTTPARVEMLACITRNYNARARFGAECG